MIRKLVWTIIACIIIVALGWLGRIYFGIGPGAFKRHLTMSGIITVCRPNGYDAVCFMDADNDQGGLSCLSLTSVGGQCR